MFLSRATGISRLGTFSSTAPSKLSAFPIQLWSEYASRIDMILHVDCCIYELRNESNAVIYMHYQPSHKPLNIINYTFINAIAVPTDLSGRRSMRPSSRSPPCPAHTPPLQAPAAPWIGPASCARRHSSSRRRTHTALLCAGDSGAPPPRAIGARRPRLGQPPCRQVVSGSAKAHCALCCASGCH